LRKTLPTFCPRRLIREFDLPISHAALERISRQHGLMSKRRHKYQRKHDLAQIKARWPVFQQISADTKDLDDIPNSWEQAQRLDLPIVQSTARHVRIGAFFHLSCWIITSKNRKDMMYIGPRTTEGRSRLLLRVSSPAKG
jgi:hypothetical protein